MFSQKRDLTGLDEGLGQQILHDHVLVCSSIMGGMDTEDNVYASVYREVTALNSRKGLTHMLSSCLVSNSIGFMQKSSLCHIAQSCKAPGKMGRTKQLVINGFVGTFGSRQ